MPDEGAWNFRTTDRLTTSITDKKAQICPDSLRPTPS